MRGRRNVARMAATSGDEQDVHKLADIRVDSESPATSDLAAGDATEATFDDGVEVYSADHNNSFNAVSNLYLIQADATTIRGTVIYTLKDMSLTTARCSQGVRL